MKYEVVDYNEETLIESYLLGMECARKKEIVRYANLMKTIDIQKTLLENLSERYEDS